MLLPFISTSKKDIKMTHIIINEAIPDTITGLALQNLVREPKVKSTKQKAIVLLHGVGSNEQDLFSLANIYPMNFS